MPTGVYVRTEKARKNYSLSQKKLYAGGYISPNKGKIHTEEARRNMSLACKGRIFSEEHKKNLSIAQVGRKLSEESYKKQSLSMKKRYNDGWINPFQGKHHTPEECKKNGERKKGTHHSAKTKQKIRFGLIEYMKSNGVTSPMIGKYESFILDNIELKNNITILRQFPVNGYFIDGYDFMNNIAYEVDESFHLNQTVKDKLRQTNIENYLKCNFIRIEVGY